MRKLWRALLRPSARWSILALVIVGIVIGVALIVLPHVGIKLTSTTEFCVSCHSMQPVYQEYKQSVHFQNASGVRAECHDCHIPPDIPGMVKRKLEASNDLYQTFIAHSIDTPEKFEAKRAELAEREWARMKENNSATCRSCHNYDAMDHAKQNPEAARQMKIAAKENQSCIDCHKGIAHQLPDMSSGSANSLMNCVPAPVRIMTAIRSIRWISSRFTPLKAIKNRQVRCYLLLK